MSKQAEIDLSWLRLLTGSSVGHHSNTGISTPSSDGERPTEKGQSRRVCGLREALLHAAFLLMQKKGLEGITFGEIANRTGVSKSSALRPFGSRECLLQMLIVHYQDWFEREVVLPSFQAHTGVQRLLTLLLLWIRASIINKNWDCLLEGHFLDRVKFTRDAGTHINQIVEWWSRVLRLEVEKAISIGELPAETVSQQLVFELYGLMLALYSESRMSGSLPPASRVLRAFARIVGDHRIPMNWGSELHDLVNLWMHHLPNPMLVMYGTNGGRARND
jgi:AcrR family transcriptional regulator